MQKEKGVKMNWKNRLTNYNFWISIVSAVLLILQAFEFHFDIMYINEIATAVLGLLVVIGIINDPTKSVQKKEENTSNSEEEQTVNSKNSDEVLETVTNAESECLEEQNTLIKNLDITDEENLINNLHKIEESLALNEQQNFPINKQDEIATINSEDDYENIVKNIVSEISNGKIDEQKFFQSLLNLLEKCNKNAKNNDFLENFQKNSDFLNQNAKDDDNSNVVGETLENQTVFDLNSFNESKTEDKIDTISDQKECLNSEQDNSCNTSVSFNIVN